MAITFEVAPVDVANEALGIIGKDFIIDLDDPLDPVAVKSKRYFESTLRAMLRDHPWNFAKRRIELAWTGIAPVNEWAYAYALPPDCMRVLQVNNNDKSLWKVEGRELLSDESEVIIEYIKWIDDPNFWGGAFYQTFVTYLAVRLAPTFNSDMAKSNDLYKTYQAQLWDARAIDGQEGSQEQMVCTDLTDDIRE